MQAKSSFEHQDRNAVDSYRERYRLQYHFSAERNWINDPCGLIFHKGEYHLFYQYNPYGDQWGHMHWGHAVSGDLVRWDHLPVALPESNGVMAFTGCTVWDKDNTSGLGTISNPPLVALFTGYRKDGIGQSIQDQRVAYSFDHGRSWDLYRGNPVLDIGCAEFRDPDVFWYEPAEEWRMAVVMATERRVDFYGSSNLLKWKPLGQFGLDPQTGEAEREDTYEWECPNMFPLPVTAEVTAQKWLLVVSTQGRPKQRSLKKSYGIRYFIGHFNGSCFVADDLGSILWVDNACDFYAMQAWNGIPAQDGRKIWIGWFNYNEDVAELPVSPWRGSHTIPRELSLIRTRGGLRLAQQPIRELRSLRNGSHHFSDISVDQLETTLRREPINSQTLEIAVHVRLLSTTAKFSISVLVDDMHRTDITVSASGGNSATVAVDTKNTGVARPECPDVYTAEVDLDKDRSCDIHAFVDWSSLEVFSGRGTAVFSVRVFPPEKATGVTVHGNEVLFEEFTVYPLGSIW